MAKKNLIFVAGFIFSSCAHHPAISRSVANDAIGCTLPAGSKTKPFDRDSVITPEVRASWAPNHFTDPAHHDARNFRYIVHMIEFANGRHSTRAIYKYLTQEIAQNPCATISTSVIDQDHRSTYGTFGFILKVPADNILLARSSDIASQYLPGNTEAERFNYALNNSASYIEPTPTLENLIKGTTAGHNEILVEGKFKEGIQVVGVIYNPVMLTIGDVKARVQDLLDIAVENDLAVVQY